MTDKKRPAGGNRRGRAKLDIAGPVSARQYNTKNNGGQPTQTPDMGRAALWYARQGLAGPGL